MGHLNLRNRVFKRLGIISVNFNYNLLPPPAKKNLVSLSKLRKLQDTIVQLSVSSDYSVLQIQQLVSSIKG